MAGKFPSLLMGVYRPAGEIDAQVFTDTNLDKLLPEETLKILALPCPAPLIAARQEIFALLGDGVTLTRFEALGGAAVGLSQAYDSYKSARNRLEELLLFRRFAALYAAFCRQAEEFDAGAELISEFGAFFRSRADMTRRLEMALAATAMRRSAFRSAGLFSSNRPSRHASRPIRFLS